MHSLLIEDRKSVTITDVVDVESFDEENIFMILAGGGLVLRGENLQIQKLDVEEGKAAIRGSLTSATYTAKKEKQEGSLLKRILK